MLVSCGLTRAVLPDGREFTFRPSFERIAELGHPHEIVEIFAELHNDTTATSAARYVLLTLCDTDAYDLTGYVSESGRTVAGLMPDAEAVILARHLMTHGICGRPSGNAGQFSPEFNASEYIASAVVHFGMTAAEAGQLSMTQFQDLFAAKFPEQVRAKPPTRDEYDAFMTQIRANRERRNGSESR